MSPTLSPKAQPDQQYGSDLQNIRERIVRFAASKVGKERAEDIAQACVELLLGKYPHVRDATIMMKIAVGIAHNKMFEQFRQDKREPQFPKENGDQANKFEEAIPDRTDIHGDLERAQVADRIMSAMLRLGEKCRNLLRLKLIEQKDSADIQKILGVNSINTVYTWQRRCLKRLIEGAGGTLYTPENDSREILTQGLMNRHQQPNGA